MSTSFVERAETAMNGGAAEGVQLMLGQPPPVLDMWGRRAMPAPLLAAFLWAAVAFRTSISTGGLDGSVLFLRLLALAFSARALWVSAELLKRMMGAAKHAQYKLALCDEGLLLRTPEADYAVAKDDIIDVREPGDWGDRAGRRWADVYVVTRPESGRTHLALPPYFGATPGVLAERLMRWRGVVPAPEERTPAEPVELPSKLFDAAARGEVVPQVTVLRHGRAYLKRAPIATVLLGAAVLWDWIRLPSQPNGAIPAMPALLGIFALVIVPAGWLAMTRRDIAPRKGISLVITPAELLMRTRAGVHRIALSSVARFEIHTRTGWSVLQGAHPQRALLIHLKDRETITYAEDFLGTPVEVVLALCEAYRKGVLP